MKTHLSRETLGTFIDAVYAIAVTILALEIPGDLKGDFFIGSFGEMLVEYVLSFTILFALWLQHRRIHGLHEELLATSVVWINSVVLLLVCLIPRATTLVFSYGGDVTLLELEASLFHGAGWNLSEFVDTFYVSVVVAADLVLLTLVGIAARDTTDNEKIRIRRSKIVLSVLTLCVLLSSLLLPFENRYFLFLIPLTLTFERNITRLLFRKS